MLLPSSPIAFIGDPGLGIVLPVQGKLKGSVPFFVLFHVDGNLHAGGKVGLPGISATFLAKSKAS